MNRLVFIFPGVIAGVAAPLVFAGAIGHTPRPAVGESLLVLVALVMLGLAFAPQAPGWDAVVLIVGIATNGAAWLAATLVTATWLGRTNRSSSPPSGP